MAVLIPSCRNSKTTQAFQGHDANVRLSSHFMAVVSKKSGKADKVSNVGVAKLNKNVFNGDDVIRRIKRVWWYHCYEQNIGYCYSCHSIDVLISFLIRIE